ncbi:MAG: DUF1902 domain-containing protein [Clostridia bacterium]|nr:DUF1902 domain-containing protein [Clostridia bacterium]
MNYSVFCTWDEEAKVWIATSPDIIGLVLESESLDLLMERANDAIPELLELNSQKPASIVSYVCNRTQSMECA